MSSINSLASLAVKSVTWPLKRVVETPTDRQTTDTKAAEVQVISYLATGGT